LVITGRTWLGATAAEGGVALLLSLLLTFPGYLLGKLGAGDLKLLAALALATDRLVLLGSFIGAGLAMLLWILIRQKFITQENQRLTATDIHTDTAKPDKHPFAPFLFAGFLMVMLAFHQP
jgi:prepilin peptidase CpaA